MQHLSRFCAPVVLLLGMAVSSCATSGQLYLVTRATEDIVAGDFTVNVGVMMNAYMPNKTTPVTIQIT